MSPRWRHIAGLGFGKKSSVAERARQALATMLQQRREAGEGVQFIFMAGDLAVRGGEAWLAERLLSACDGSAPASPLRI